MRREKAGREQVSSEGACHRILGSTKSCFQNLRVREYAVGSSRAHQSRHGRRARGRFGVRGRPHRRAGRDPVVVLVRDAVTQRGRRARPCVDYCTERGKGREGPIVVRAAVRPSSVPEHEAIFNSRQGPWSSEVSCRLQKQVKSTTSVT
jgi:hypothetical protein